MYIHASCMGYLYMCVRVCVCVNSSRQVASLAGMLYFASPLRRRRVILTP